MTASTPPRRRGLRRLSYAQRQILQLLRLHDHLSYDAMAAELEIDRNTAIQAIRRLEKARRVVVVRGRGTVPNRYIRTDRLILW